MEVHLTVGGKGPLLLQAIISALTRFFILQIRTRNFECVSAVLPLMLSYLVPALCVCPWQMLLETEEFIKWLWITSPNVSNIYRLLTICKAFHINCLNNKCRAGNLPEVTWPVWISKEFWSQVRTFIARKMQFKYPSNIEWYLAQNITHSWFSYFLSMFLLFF